MKCSRSFFITKNNVFLIHRQLEDELQAEKKRMHRRESDWKGEMEKLREDNERQQKLLSLNLTKSPQSQTEAYMQYEIKRLTGENLVSYVRYVL